MKIPLESVWLFGLVLVRLSGVFISAPLFSNSSLPMRVKAGLLIVLSAFIAGTLPTLDISQFSLPQFLPLVAGELVIGMVIGFGFHALVAIATIAGELIGLQMGIGASSLFDPISGGNRPVLSSALALAFTVLFVTIDGHHHVLRAFSESYTMLPIGRLQELPPLELMLAYTTHMIGFGVRLAAPVAVPIFMITVASGLISRVFPQANVFSISYSLSMLVGLVLLGLTVPGFREALSETLVYADRFTARSLQLMAGG